ncbi:hypothetical protein [Stenotrophomonas sp. AS1]|uniref:hypothetical protein n=1 Tax=Stenotrophomonas sp. AS1 TaxID=3029188 RepID=UPI003B7D95DA
MAVPVWNPGTLYQPGDIVQPITAPTATAAQVENGDFAAGNVNWDFTGGAEFVTTGGYSGNGSCVRMPGSVPEGLALNKTKLVVPSTGSTFEATAMIQQGASIAGATRGWVEVRWYDSSDLLILSERGNVVSDGSGGAWHQSKLTATRPAGAAYARAGIALFSVADHTHAIFGDNLSVSGTFAGLPDGLVYKAVQPESGFSASDEPAWPPILGQQVIDNDVIWEAVASTRVTWEASPLYVSGSIEPDWPTDIGGFVRDGTIDWKAVSRRVEDPNCPNSKIVVIAASKVFAGDDDIVRYSATVNPLDWTTPDDAGYLPTGLQNYGANPVAAMGLYRSNLVVFNSEAFQLWQVDEDPASMALIDALPLGSTQHRSIAPVANDLFFASSQGIRSIGIAASSTNYQAGDVGMPIDPLVEPIMRLMKGAGEQALGLYYPSAGQYWLCFPGYPPAPLKIVGDVPGGLVGQFGTGKYTVVGGIKPYSVVAVSSGTPPPGLTINADGTYAYSFAEAGSFAWEVSVTDAQGTIAKVADSAVVGNEAVWLARGPGATSPAYLGPYKIGTWQPTASAGVAARYAWSFGGVFHLSDPATTAYRYSKNQGQTWLNPGSASISASGGRMAVAGGYSFVCGGVNPLLRRANPDGPWETPATGTNARANDILSIGNRLVIVASSPRNARVSTDFGVTWTAGVDFAPGSSTFGSIRIATDGARIAILYNDNLTFGSNIKYSDDFGATWSSTVFSFPLPGSSNLGVELFFDGVYWLAFNETGRVARSLDAVEWQLLPVTIGKAAQVAAGKGVVMAACGTSGLYWSEDHGWTWQKRSVPSALTDVTGIAWIDPNVGGS